MLEVLLYTLERFSVSQILMPPRPVFSHNEIATHRYFHRLNICTRVCTQVNSFLDQIYSNMKILFLKSLVLTWWQPSSFVTGHPREFLRELSRINLFCIAISIDNVKVIRIIMVTIVFMDLLTLDTTSKFFIICYASRLLNFKIFIYDI